MTKNINNLFFIFLFIHLLLWVLVPSLTNKNLPLDTIEALAWGSNLDWGFKNIHHLVLLLLKYFIKFLEVMIGLIICLANYL